MDNIFIWKSVIAKYKDLFQSPHILLIISNNS